MQYQIPTVGGPVSLAAANPSCADVMATTFLYSETLTALFDCVQLMLVIRAALPPKPRTDGESM